MLIISPNFVIFCIRLITKEPKITNFLLGNYYENLKNTENQAFFNSITVISGQIPTLPGKA